LRQVSGDREFESLVEGLEGETANPNETAMGMTAAERAASTKLYYHQGGWASAIRLLGAEDVIFGPDRVTIEYRHVALRTPPELQQAKRRFIAKKRKESNSTGTVFFDGPNTRLLGFRASPTDEYSALELPHLTLHLGPVGWYDYEGLNEAFREQLQQGPPEQFYEYYIGLSDLVNHGDLSKCRLSNLMETAATIITVDGYLLYAKRTRRVDSSEKLTSAVAENINRYLDDTIPSNPIQLVHSLPQSADEPLDSGLDARYVPIGVPNPFAAVRRGLSSEISPRAADAVPFTAIKITGIAFDLEILHPTLLFVIFSPLSREDLFELYKREPGSEVYEASLEAVRADSRNNETVAVLRDRDWVQTGKASVIRAMEVIESVRRKRECTFTEAINTLNRA
jgi:hypothetical protein